MLLVWVGLEGMLVENDVGMLLEVWPLDGVIIKVVSVKLGVDILFVGP